MTRLSGLLIVLSLLFAITLSAAAWAGQEAFTVRDLRADITAESASEARDKAFAQVHREAFDILAQRLVADGDYNRIPQLDDDVIMSLTRDFEIMNEQLSSVRYVADFVVTFDEARVRRHFERSGVRYTSYQDTQPVIMIPLFAAGAAGEKTNLWDFPNPWRAAWRLNNLRKGLVPIVVPAGDLDDMRDMKGANALSASPETLERMMERYGATDVLMAHVKSQAPKEDGTLDLEVTIYGTGGSKPHHWKSLAVSGKGNEAYMEAVKDVRKFVAQSWKRKALKDPDVSGGSIRVVAHPSNLSDWAEMQNALKAAGGTLRYKVVSLRPGRVELDLMFSGSEGRLRSALNQGGLDIKGGNGQGGRELVFIY